MGCGGVGLEVILLPKEQKVQECATSGTGDAPNTSAGLVLIQVSQTLHLTIKLSGRDIY